MISNTFPYDLDVTMAKNKLYAIKQFNPKMIVKIWKTYIADKYKELIQNGDLNFFIEKNYDEDLDQVSNSNKIMNCVNRLRDPIRKMEKDKQELTMSFIQDLSKISNAITIK
jgi:hypothetical protein